MGNTIPIPKRLLTRDTVSWAFYDWANSAYATTVMAGFFPLFYKEFWCSHADPTVSTFHLGVYNSVAALVAAGAAPVLGAVADAYRIKKRLLLFFAALGIVLTGAFYFIAQGAWLIAGMIYIGATVGFSVGNVFYDSLIFNIADKKDFDIISAAGYSLGYLGGGLLFSINVAMVLRPHLFGLANSTAAIKISFISVSCWWAIFSIPLILNVRETRAESADTLLTTISMCIVRVGRTLKRLRSMKSIGLFLISYWLYIDGVDTIIKMAVDFGISVGLASRHLITALLITQFISFPAALIFGIIGTKLNAKKGILMCISVYVAVTFWAYFMDETIEFYILAAMVGTVQGGIQALSRSLFASLIPPDSAAELFGFYNMLGKFAAIFGPILMGTVAVVTGNSRLSILSLLVLFVSGAVILCLVDENERAL